MPASKRRARVRFLTSARLAFCTSVQGLLADFETLRDGGVAVVERGGADDKLARKFDARDASVPSDYAEVGVVFVARPRSKP